MKYVFFIKDSDAKQLEIWQETPSKGDKFPTIILVSGFGTDLHEYGYFDEITDILLRNGFGVVRFNFEGLGKSGGDFIDMTIVKQTKQLQDVINYIKKDRFADLQKIGIMAHSFGTATCLVALPLDIKSFLFTGTATDPRDSLERYFNRQRGYNPEGISKRERADNRIVRIGPQFWQNLESIDLKSKVKLIDQPILFIQGEKDINTKPWQVEEFFNLVQAKKRFLMIEKGNHSLTGKFRLQVLKLIKDWFNETLR